MYNFFYSYIYIGPLHNHLQAHGVDYLQFSFRWMNNLLTRELPLHSTIRLWDTYLAESDGFAVFQLYVCAAFLLHWREQLLKETEFQVCDILHIRAHCSHFVTFDILHRGWNFISTYPVFSPNFLTLFLHLPRAWCCCYKIYPHIIGTTLTSVFWSLKHTAWNSPTQMHPNTSRVKADYEIDFMRWNIFKWNEIQFSR